MEDYKSNISPLKYQDYEFTLNVPDNIYVITQTNVGERAKIERRPVVSRPAAWQRYLLFYEQ